MGLFVCFLEAVEAIGTIDIIEAIETIEFVCLPLQHLQSLLDDFLHWCGWVVFENGFHHFGCWRRWETEHLESVYGLAVDLAVDDVGSRAAL